MSPVQGRGGPGTGVRMPPPAPGNEFPAPSPPGGLRAVMARALLRLLRLYTFHAPWRRGSYRLMMLAAPLTRFLRSSAVVPTRDGRRLWIDWRSGGVDTIYFFGEYERAVSVVVRDAVAAGDVCIDAGANMGWYTTLLRSCCGASGSVHAFEPVPATFERLRRNVDLSGAPDNVVLNRVALGDRVGDTEVHVFDDLPDGHASLSSMQRSDTDAVPCPMTTLDAYLRRHDVGDVAFVKLDVEGAELRLLRGATALFEQRIPPTFVIEMASDTSRHFGHEPNDLIEFLASRHPFEFFAIDEKAGTLKPLERFPTGSPGAYVLCVPQGRGQQD